MSNRQAEENVKFGDIERDRQEKTTEAETALERAQREFGSLMVEIMDTTTTKDTDTSSAA